MHENDKREILTAIAESRNAAHQQAQKTREVVRGIIAQLERIITPIIHNTTVVVSGQSIHVPGLKDFQGEDDMSNSTYSDIPRDHQDEPFTLSPIVISDSEGPIEVPVTDTLTSDNPDVVSIIGDAPNQSFHFGTFGTATVSRKATFTPPGGVETTVNAASAVFNLTPGALTVSSDIVISGLTPDV